MLLSNSWDFKPRQNSYYSARNFHISQVSHAPKLFGHFSWCLNQWLYPFRGLQKRLANIAPLPFCTFSPYQLEVALPKLSIDQHVLYIAWVGMQYDRSNRVAPAEHIRRVAIKYQNVCFGADLEHADIGPPQRKSALSCSQQERLVDLHRGLVGNQACVERLVVTVVARSLQPDPGLREHITREGEGCVDSQRRFWRDEMACCLPMAVVTFGLGRYRDEEIVCAQCVHVVCGQEGRVGEDHGDADSMQTLCCDSCWGGISFWWDVRVSLKSECETYEARDRSYGALL